MPLLKCADPSELKLYELYVHRIMKHYDLALTQFNIYFGINLALMAAAGFLLGSPKVAIPATQILHYITPGLAALGSAISLAWLFVNRDARRWQLLMNKVLAELEAALLQQPELHGLYHRINAAYAPTRRVGLDLIDINVFVAGVFIIAWLVIGVIAPRLAAG